MAAVASEAERAVLEEEFKWLLREEVHAVLKQLKDVLKEASRRFTLSATGPEGQTRQENFKLGSSATDQVKGVLTLQGDALTQADINLRLPKHNQVLHCTFREDKQWKLQQLMDAVMLQLTRARNRLTTPAAMTLPEVASSSLMKMFTPPLPGDVFANFYINLSKLCLIVYQLHLLQPNLNKNFKPAGSSVLHNPGSMFEMNNQKFEVSHVHKVECVVPWLNDTLVFFTIALQLCQQLKDKISVFSSYWNFKPY
ncbi:protein rogdi homolog isoform X3 [Chiloscyllium plagiosum]|uniref:protein rogdi homolog isoform X3 n=1 Tax=Chiloscyllium plagiosum TaxID=36176 RepID=UPI001CB7F859|nr:protein rogdi homolog isoform X3 [Chiloscyllium plagiosum]